MQNPLSSSAARPRDLLVWQHAAARLRAGQPVALLCVLSSHGSSPGRQGFKMSVGLDEDTAGSIGGGIMEHKFVDLARARLREADTSIVRRPQIHRREAPTDRSGMICSGEQVVLLFPLQLTDLPAVEGCIAALEQLSATCFTLSEAGLQVRPATPETPSFTYDEGPDWRYTERLGFRDQVTIVGGGHVALALSRILATLDFELTVLDDRPDLNTLAQNPYAHHKRTVPYDTLAREIPEGPNQYIVIMTFGYRPDEVALRQLLHHRVKYLGLMGSRAKIAELMNSLRNSGGAEEALARVHAPIGVPINSRTPEEIAISVAAELIGVRNAG
ncbi:xanthine dehydrogenase accessory factor [Hymenobacter daecheongensis DSM 21074]|uniref:Xanthine dehydrogenase accessory factor n=1 Tax=Hymenobacter daecheongensis DSM 21074 TaxID=1121955 RepID=A0A1M6GJ48_9BACT|nr:XdhC/CoxI family protein [Hymenobacter daecheongensis]SHJ09938.1 xanthine dehydrogenase accessory factor [Hymenobacter daecheongensis DSM 21074]